MLFSISPALLRSNLFLPGARLQPRGERAPQRVVQLRRLERDDDAFAGEGPILLPALVVDVETETNFLRGVAQHSLGRTCGLAMIGHG